MGLQERIKKLSQEGYSEQINSFLSKLEVVSKLPQELKDKLEKIGNTPIEEPKIYELAKNNADLTEVLIEIYKKDNDKQENDLKTEIALDSKKYGLEILVQFARKAVSKCTDLERDDGSVKSTPNTENCDFPDIFQVKEYQEKQMELSELFNEYYTSKKDTRQLDEMSEEELKEFDEKMEEMNNKTSVLAKELEEMCLSFSGLKVEELNEWEKQLVQLNIDKYVSKAFSKTIMGKQFGML